MSAKPSPLALTAPGVHGTYSHAGYQAVRSAGMSGLSFSGGGGERHQRYDRLKLIDQSRDFYRNNGIYRGMLERAVDYIVGGTGFSLRAKSRSKRFNQGAEKLWKRLWRLPDVAGRLSGVQVERMVCREMLMCGDVGAIKTANWRVQLIEAEQIAGHRPYREDGQVCDAVGRAVAYWVCGYGKYGALDYRRARKILPRDFIFAVDPDRPSSRRGVPPAQSSFPMLHRINDVCDSEAIAWQLLARLAVSIHREEADTLAHAGSRADEDADGTEMATRVQELGYALIFHGRPGEEVRGIERNIPGKDFSASLTMFLRLLGLPLGLPLEITLLDWTKSNYSQSRAVIEQAYQRFLFLQNLIGRFLTEVYRWQVRGWIGAGQLPDRADWDEHDWIVPAFPWLDRLKEAQAYGEQLDRGMTTLGQVCKSLRTDRDDVVAAREAEVREAIERAQKIEADTGQRVPWEYFAGLKPGATAAAPAAAEVADEADEVDEAAADAEPDGETGEEEQSDDE